MTEPRQLVMVIDDNEIDRNAVAGLIRDRYEVAEAATGTDGLDQITRRKPDCVLLELRVADAASSDIRRKLHQGRTAVVILRSRADGAETNRLTKGDTREYFVFKESMTRDSLRAAVKTAIDRQTFENRLERYRMAMENMPVGVMILHHTETTFACVAANAAAGLVFGIGPEKIARAPILPILVSLLGPAVEPACLKVLADGETVHLPQWRRAQPGLADQVWDVRIAWLSPGLLILTLDNITVRIAAEKKQLDTEQLLKAAQRLEAVGLLTAGVAHDFNNFLTVILGYAEIASQHDPKPQVRDALTQIHRAATRAAEVTRQLLAFSRQESDSMWHLNLNAVLADMNRMVDWMTGENIEYRSLLAPDLWLINADPSHVEQVVMNLVVNARDALPEGGSITVETSNVELDLEFCKASPDLHPGPYVSLSVSDTGTGMDAATQVRIFEPFFTTKAIGKGTGLGLSTIREILRKAHGHISVYSESGKGTTFRVFWPTGTGSGGSARPRNIPAILPRGTETILVTENDDQLRRLATEVLSECGYTVIEAGDGLEALRRAGAHEGPIGLLMTDVSMPWMDGIELAAKMKALRPDIRVLFTSGYTAAALIDQGVPSEGLNFLAKPFQPINLASKVRNVLEPTTAKA